MPKHTIPLVLASLLTVISACAEPQADGGTLMADVQAGLAVGAPVDVFVPDLALFEAEGLPILWCMGDASCPINMRCYCADLTCSIGYCNYPPRDIGGLCKTAGGPADEAWARAEVD